MPSIAISLDNAWVAVQVKPYRERFAATQLMNMGYECFLPTHLRSTTENGRRATAEKQADRALFPGYFFCRYKINPGFRIFQASSVIRVVGCGGAPATIPEEEIAAVRRVVESQVYSEPWRLVKSGERVYVCAGPLSGLIGVLARTKNKLRVVVNVSLLHRSVAAEVGIGEVLPISQSLDLHGQPNG